ncbi:MAG TPA: hypothetical protein VF837_01280 [Patescibacteria group bacterium]
MVIEFSNVKTPAHRTNAVTFALISATIFLFIPTSIVVLGYYSSQPTGNLISPLPQGVLSEISPTPTDNLPIIAAPNDASMSSISQTQQSNSSDHSVTLLANTPDVTVQNTTVTENSQILIVPKESDKSIYYVKSKASGSFVIATETPSNMDRVIDYQIVSP